MIVEVNMSSESNWISCVLVFLEVRMPAFSEQPSYVASNAALRKLPAFCILLGVLAAQVGRVSVKHSRSGICNATGIFSVR